MGAVTSLFLRKVVAAAGADLDRAALLASVGLDPESEGDVARMISDDDYYTLLERILAESGGAGALSLRVGASMDCDDYGAFGLAWKAAPSLRGSFARAELYWRLLTSVVEYELVPEARGAWFTVRRRGQPRPGMCLSNEATLASVLSLIRQVSPGDFAPLEVRFSHRAMSDPAAYSTYFGCRVVFDADRDAMLVSADRLAARNRLGDEAITRFLLPHLDRELDRVTARDGLRGQVQDAVAGSLSEGVPRMAAIARDLGMGERTLQRRLAEEGLSFQALVDAARRDLAEGLLTQSDYSLAEIAFLTGFSEQSAFSRAFKRWTARTPAAFREGARLS